MVDTTTGYGDMPYGDRDTWVIDDGYEVYGADGDKIGDVSEVHTKYLIVSKGFLFPTDKYVPVGAIENVADGKVYLNVTKDRINDLGWDREPSDETAFYDYGAERPYTDYDWERRDVETAGTATVDRDVETDEDVTIPLVEEELSVSKRPVRRGIVRVEKGVTSEQRTVNVPLREEEVRVERHAVDRAVEGDVPAGAFEEREYEIPLRGEEADVSKRAVVREEVEIDKDVVQRDERVGGTVRREEVHVEGADVERRENEDRGAL